MNTINRRSRTVQRLLGSVAGVCLLAAAGAAQAIIIAGPGTPTTAIDPEAVTGVGQMVMDQGGGVVGLCTGTLINPRTVLFAATCVNKAAATSYGAGSGGRAIGFGFSVDNRPATVSYILGPTGKFQTTVANNFYNSNFIAYNPQSLIEPSGLLNADLATAALDTPAANVPTWALLFSALPAPTGAGYHVSLSGYGNNGTGVTGSNGAIDFRRRIAENTLGALTSVDKFDSFLFGPNLSANDDQSQYWLDFDDPRRGTPSASAFDPNVIRDNALPREGMTGPGDNGSPLILDQTYATPVVVGVNSGGYNRFFVGAPANSYGSASFYQPLYLQWEWIAANNPYHYVSSRAGDANWTDIAHWTTTLDPNYRTLDANGNLVNGVPTVTGGGIGNGGGQWGTVCVELSGTSNCQNQASVATPSTTALPAASLQNGLPGATGFMPNNYDGDRLNAVAPRYFDVNLAAAGTTTLNTAVAVDRLSVSSAGAALSIDTAGALTSNIDVTQWTGAVQVNGALTSRGDYMMLTGRLGGTGTVTAPFFTNIAGAISPATTGTAGTLTFAGNIILSSGSGYLVDLAAGGVSDKVVVKATQFSGGAPVDGKANVGGGIGFTLAPGLVPHAGDSYTILTAEGGVTGSFNTPAPISAVLQPRLTYSANSVSMKLEAGSYSAVVGNSAMQRFYAPLLDQARGQSGAPDDLYASLDLLNAADVNTTLDGFTPYAEGLRISTATAAFEVASSFYRERTTWDAKADAGGTLSITGRPAQMAETAFESRGGPLAYATTGSETVTLQNVLPQSMNGYVVAGYLDGEGAALSLAPAGSRDPFDGMFFAGGVEIVGDSRSMLGASASYTDLSGETAALAQEADSKLALATIYGRRKGDSGLVYTGQFSVGRLDSRTSRTAVVGATTYTLHSRDTAVAFAAEAGLAKVVFDKNVEIMPRGSIRLSRIALSPVSEVGGGPALSYDRGAATAAEARIGVSITGKSQTVTPYLTADVVHALSDKPEVLSANLAGGFGASTVFAIAGKDQNWGEIGLGLKADLERFTASVAAQATTGRSDIETRTYTAAVKFRF